MSKAVLCCINIRVSERLCTLSLSRHHVWILALRSGRLAGHQKPQLSHAFGTSSRLRLRTITGLVLAIAMLLVELFLAALTLLLEAFDDVDGTARRTVDVIKSITSSSIQARGSILTAKGVGSAR